MSGIAGIISRKPASECQTLVRAMVASMENEPFHVSGSHFVPQMGIYVGWVAHAGSFAADQVFLNEQRNIALLFAGKCHVDPQLRRRLKLDGHQFGEHGGDCLPHLYEEQDEAFFPNLNGICSGLLIDERRHKAFLFNDRYGLERIYWHQNADGFYFASEAKALLRVLPELREFDPDGVAQYLAFGSTLESRTLFRGISLLPGGSCWAFENEVLAKRDYFSPVTWEARPALSIEAFESQFQDTVRRILPRYTDSKSRLGISLTAGLDTRMIMACLPQSIGSSVCYTYSGERADTLDARLAARVATACGMEHHILRIGVDFFANFQAWADKTVYATDGYFGVSGAHEIYFSQQARGLSPERLTGVFGGEILRGVSTFRPIGLAPELIHPERLAAMNATVESARKGADHPVTFAAFREIPWNMFGTVMACRSQLSFRSPYLDNELVALAYQAPLSSRRSCDSAVRLVRNSSKTLGEIPTDMGYLGNRSGLTDALSRMMARFTFKLDYYNNEGLPHVLSPLDPVLRRLASGARILGHHKFLHYRSWFRKELAPYVSEVLADLQTRKNPLWNEGFLKRLAGDHVSGRKNFAQEINAVLTIEAVERLLFRNFPAKSVPAEEVRVQSDRPAPVGQL